jgi:predicted acetyltransferase
MQIREKTVEKPAHNVELIPATIENYPVIQNMARFYVYDRSQYMGWGCSEDGMFDCIDFKHYFKTIDHKAFIIKVDDELAGFALLDKTSLLGTAIDWNIGEFFIIAKFQSKGMGRQVAQQIFEQFQGAWTVAVMPQNVKASNFWYKIINDLTDGNFEKYFTTAE